MYVNGNIRQVLPYSVEFVPGLRDHRTITRIIGVIEPQPPASMPREYFSWNYERLGYTPMLRENTDKLIIGPWLTDHGEARPAATSPVQKVRGCIRTGTVSVIQLSAVTAELATLCGFNSLADCRDRLAEKYGDPYVWVIPITHHGKDAVYEKRSRDPQADRVCPGILA